ncbi:hypothetical protein HF521_005031 [Silurus meridionalis]|uniref:Uncharacterized protein n=2 Tax=Silurus meridionalis TaxID=175797 RepID=A0A8T0AWH6_SILME|nr:hypothetical protein HF521_005031 [Silurus meridionalis]
MFILKRDSKVILRGKIEVHTLKALFEDDGLEIFSSGSVKIRCCEENHTGKYLWETWNSMGNLLCNFSFTLNIYDRRHLSSPDLLSVCQSFAEVKPSTTECSLRPHDSSTDLLLRENICLNRKVFLLLCGVMAMFLTLITALCCVSIMLRRTSSPSDHPPGVDVDVIYTEVDICRKGKRNRKKHESVKNVTEIYSEVNHEPNQETRNLTFTTYGLDEINPV